MGEDEVLMEGGGRVDGGGMTRGSQQKERWFEMWA